MVEVTVSRRVELQSLHANVVKSLVVNAESSVRVFHELVNGKDGVVGFDNRVGNFRGRGNRVRDHHAVRKLLANLAQSKRSKTRAGTTTKRVKELETLERVRGLGLVPDRVEDLVREFGTFRVVSLGPVVARTGLCCQILNVTND